MPKDAGTEFQKLLEVMARLRGDQGCPWDREQTLGSLRPYVIEEAYEVLDEMDQVVRGGPWRGLCEELGDLLFQVVFQSQIATERGQFDIAEVCRQVGEKLIRRHPHVFGGLQVKDSEQVHQNWVKLKAAERREKTGDEGSVLEGVPSAAPALMRAERLTEKASRIGFDWRSIGEVREKVSEEIAELDQAIASGDPSSIEHELGDLLFALVNLARFTRTPAEDALRQANDRFVNRFRFVEDGLRREGIALGQPPWSKWSSFGSRRSSASNGLRSAINRPPSARNLERPVCSILHKICYESGEKSVEIAKRQANPDRLVRRC